MKLLQSIRSVNPAGGGVIEVVKQFSRVLEQRGHEVVIVSLDAPEDPWVANCPHAVIALGNSLREQSGAIQKEGQCTSGNGYGYSPRFIPWLRQHATEFDCAIIHGLWQFNSFAVRRALRDSSVPYFVFPHGMLDPWFKRAYPLKHLKKWLYWPWAEYRVLADARAVLFTCEQERELARQSFWLYRATERVVSLGVADPGAEDSRQRDCFLDRFPECRGKRLVLFLGRLHEKKGCDLLLRAFARVAGSDDALRLVLAGPEQQDASSMRALAADLGIADRVIWTGMLAGDLKWGAFRAAEVFALPSHQENFGIAVVEALACGVPVLISREVNIWREITQAAAGFADSDDVEGTTRLLQKWLALPPQEKQLLRLRARACFTQLFEIGTAVDHLVDVLHQEGAWADGASLRLHSAALAQPHLAAAAISPGGSRR